MKCVSVVSLDSSISFPKFCPCLRMCWGVQLEKKVKSWADCSLQLLWKQNQGLTVALLQSSKKKSTALKDKSIFRSPVALGEQLLHSMLIFYILIFPRVLKIFFFFYCFEEQCEAGKFFVGFFILKLCKCMLWEDLYEMLFIYLGDCLMRYYCHLLCDSRHSEKP